MNASHMGACCDLSLYFGSKWSWLHITLGYKPESVYIFKWDIFSFPFRIVAAAVPAYMGRRKKTPRAGQSIKSWWAWCFEFKDVSRVSFWCLTSRGGIRSTLCRCSGGTAAALLTNVCAIGYVLHNQFPFINPSIAHINQDIASLYRWVISTAGECVPTFVSGAMTLPPAILNKYLNLTGRKPE